jgi:peroxiredoxin
MIRRLLPAALLAAASLSSPAHADLGKGAKAPAISTKGALAGKAFAFDLAKALKHGPVVVYFYPKAFTQGCTLETRAFAEAMPKFRAAGASVVGMSADDLPTLKRFSTEECRSAFPVAIATPAIISAYDVKLEWGGVSTAMSKRVSYVIGRDGRIAFVHSDLDWRDHVKLTLAAVQKMKSGS